MMWFNDEAETYRKRLEKLFKRLVARIVDFQNDWDRCDPIWRFCWQDRRSKWHKVQLSHYNDVYFVVNFGESWYRCFSCRCCWGGAWRRCFGSRRVVASFVFVYMLLVLATTFAGALAGLDVFTAFTGALSMAGNIGPAFGQLGPASNYGVLAAPLKWFYMFAMLAGRLEIYTLHILVGRICFLRRQT